MDEIIEEEHSYFLRTDGDGDSKLSKSEFIKHFIDSMGNTPLSPASYFPQ